MTHVMPWAPGTKGTFLQLNAGAFWKCETIADLKSIDVSDPVFISSANDAPIVVYVLGKGLYRYVFGETTTADDAYFIMPNTGTGRWVLELVKGPSFSKINAITTTVLQSLPSAKIINFTVDCTNFTSGKATLTIDGNDSILDKGAVLSRVVEAQNISIKTEDYISSVSEIGATADNELLIPSGSSNLVARGSVWVSNNRQRMLLSTGNGKVRQYNNTGSGDIDDFVLAGDLLIATSSDLIRSIVGSPDGLTMTFFASNRTAYVYQLTSPGEILSGATLLGTRFSSGGSSTVGDVGGCCYNDNGTKFYWFNDGYAFQRTLDTPYRPDLTVGSVTSGNLGTGSGFHGLFIDNGTKFIELYGDVLRERAVSTPWDSTTISGTVTATKSIPEASGANDSPTGLYILGSRLYIPVGFFYGANDKVLDYSIGQLFSGQKIMTRVETSL